MKYLLAAFVLAAACTTVHADEKIVRICDNTGCLDRPRNTASFDPAHDDNPEETRRLAALAEIARKDPRAAYDLALRYFRGDGVKRDSYKAIQWMREAGERGVPEAYLALGRLYLSGVEEMGADPAEAEKWLTLAADRGDKDASKLLTEARTAKKSEHEQYRLREAQRKSGYGWWYHDYAYHWYWGPAGWYYR